MRAPSFSLLIVCLLCGLLAAAQAKDSNGFFQGRATYYQDNTQGSCHYGKPESQFYAAWPDSQEGRPACGNCYAVSCVNSNFHDGYGAQINRASACYDETKTIVVKVIDSCPCVHANYYSNQRWCCGDMEHLDLGEEVFKMLADEHWGVIGLKWKQTSCDKLGVVDANSGSDNKQDNSTEQSKPDIPAGYDISWLKNKIASWGSLSDNDFEKNWQSSMDSTWASKFEDKKPASVKSAFGGWRR